MNLALSLFVHCLLLGIETDADIVVGIGGPRIDRTALSSISLYRYDADFYVCVEQMFVILPRAAAEQPDDLWAFCVVADIEINPFARFSKSASHHERHEE